eukprot:GHRR01001018.1.p1 GENE.GHRR01001018.1~~GHRR01001018.1.p1  ORF type:complete len:597 (+),score=253.23 GHRR01001018.1:210-2000(+)
MCQGLQEVSSMSQSRASSSALVSAFGRRIVFFGAAEDINESKVQQLFEQHGQVMGLFLVRSALGLPSGCGYVTLATTEQAEKAVGALQGSAECADAGGKLGVLLLQLPEGCGCDSDNEDACSQVSTDPKDSRTAFFTKIPPTVTSQQLIQLFTACGEVVHLELFTPWPGAKISKGCGLVEFTSRDAAAAAVNSLHLAFTWPHSHSALVVEPVDSKRQAVNRAAKATKTATEPTIRRGAAVNGSRSHPALMHGSALLCSRSGPHTAWLQQSSAGRLQWALPASAAPAVSYVPQLARTVSNGSGSLPEQCQHLDNGLYTVDASGGSFSSASSFSVYDNSSPLSAPNPLSSTMMALSAQDVSSSGFVTSGLGCLSRQASGIDSMLTVDTSLLGMGLPAASAAPVNVIEEFYGQPNGLQGVVMLQQQMQAPDQQGNKMFVLPASAAAVSSDSQQLAARMNNPPGLFSAGLPANAGSMMPQQMNMQQQQFVCTPSGSTAAAAPQAPMEWWGQQQQVHEDKIIALVPLSAKQVQAVAAAMAEVPKLTGAQACLASGSAAGSMQLILSGKANAVQSAHSVVAALMSNMGVFEPLMPGVVQMTR